MSFFTLLGTEVKKLRRSHIIWILLIPVALLWIPAVIHSAAALNPVTGGLPPEYNFFIQSFMGLVWFMFPATMVICTVLLVQTERGNHGMLKMLSLPVRPAMISLAKFTVLILLAAVQIAAMAICYFPCAAIASHLNDSPLMLPLTFVLRESGWIFLSSLPMAALFWAVAVCVRTPIFSMGIGLASIVPSVLAINTRAWFAYPMCYPFYRIMTLMSQYSASPGEPVQLVPWIPTALAITVCALALACQFYGKKERR